MYSTMELLQFLNLDESIFSSILTCFSILAAFELDICRILQREMEFLILKIDDKNTLLGMTHDLTEQFAFVLVDSSAADYDS